MAAPRSSFDWIGRILKSPWKTDSQPETPKRYLKLVEQCLHQVQGMTSDGSIVKFHHEQCRHLVHKLEVVVTLISSKDLDTTLPSSSPWCAEEFLKICKLLYLLANEVESFILNCCKEEWIRTGMILTDVSKHVAARAFYLELLMLRLHKILGRTSLTPDRTGLESLYTDELNLVQATASVDRGILVKRLEKVIHDSNNLKNEQLRVATYVLQRLDFQHCQPESSHWEVDYGSLQRKEILARSTVGTLVHKTIWLGVEMAAKTFYGEELYPIFLKEVSTLQRLSHSNIVPLLCYATNKHENSIVMELMDGDLRFLIQKRFQSDSNRIVPFTMKESVGIMLQVAEAMNHIHENRILHRDLKSLNILVEYVEGEGVINVKVADFGISKQQEHSSTFSFQSTSKGSTRWMAPELIAVPGIEQPSSGSEKVLKYPFKSDIYSFGMLCYEILTGEVPFWEIESQAQVKEKVLCGERPKLPHTSPRDLNTLIRRCWEMKANTRPSFAEICKELQYLHWRILLGFFEQDQKPIEERPVSESEISSKYGADDAPEKGFIPVVGGYIDSYPQVHKKYGHRSHDAEYITSDDSSVKPMVLKEDISNLILKRRLGRGGSEHADVFLTTWHRYSSVHDVAQKMFLVRSVGTGSFINEISILAKLNHPNIVRLLCYAENLRTRSIIMELMDGDLNDLMQKRLTEDTTREVPFSMNEAVDVMLQIAAAMNYLHQNNIIHQDLKSDNILFKDVMEGMWDIKVADFGLSKRLGSHGNFRAPPLRRGYGKDVSNVATYRETVGTTRWMAPELMCIHGNEDGDGDASHNPYKSDVYSFAMVCSEILTGHVPFLDIQDPSEVQTKILEGDRPMLPNECSPKLKALIGRCWHPVTQVRPRFAKIIEELEGILWEQCNDHALGT